MTSESSSAVVELNDADTEDTECGSVTDDAEGVPLIMEHGCDIAVKVDAPMKQLSTLETFVTYRVRCVCARWPTPPHVRRRYNHFKVLHKRLVSSHPLLAPPPLPPLHSARQQLDRYSPTFVAVRTIALNAFLDRVAKHPILTHSEDFRIFLTTPDEEIDKVFKSENSALNLWGLSSALYSGGSSNDTKPANGARVKDPEFSAAADYLQSLQQKLTTLCALTTKLYKGSTAVGNELMGMKRACDLWACQALGACARAAAALGLGAGAGAAALARARPPLRARASLPLLAAHANAHHDKIRLRDAVHAAHVAGNNTDELHNRLEQASEALRSELSDWTPKTHAEIKSLLLEMADRQVAIHTQVLLGWEHALKLSTEADAEQLFKTVSKTAVQNLSPSKCRPDILTPTERDFDDIDNYSESDLEFKLEQDKNCIKAQSALSQGTDNFSQGNDNFSQGNDKFGQGNDNFSQGTNKPQGNCIDIEVNNTYNDIESVSSGIGINNKETDTLSPVIDIVNQENDVKAQGTSILSQGNDILSQRNDIKAQGSEVEYQNGDNASNNTENGIGKSLFEQKSLADPLHDFSEVDLSS